MQLLIITFALAIGVYLLNESACQREREIAQQNRQEAALQTYIDRMAELLLDKKLRESEQIPKIRDMAQERTLTMMRGLDGDRKGTLLRFLHEADLIDKDKRVINLNGTELRGAKYTKNAKDIRDTIWPEGFDPDAAGAIRVTE